MMNCTYIDIFIMYRILISFSAEEIDPISSRVVNMNEQQVPKGRQIG